MIPEPCVPVGRRKWRQEKNSLYVNDLNSQNA